VEQRARKVAGKKGVVAEVFNRPFGALADKYLILDDKNYGHQNAGGPGFNIWKTTPLAA
jgi:hypothetical protein